MTRRACLAAALLLLAGCTADASETSGNTDAPGNTEAPEGTATPPTFVAVGDDTRRASRAAALDVRASGCGPREIFGTATLVEPDLAITAAHVVAGSQSVRAIDVDGVAVEADVVFFDPDLDVAALRGDFAGTPAPLRDRPGAAERGVVTLPRQIDGEMVVRQLDVTVLRTVNIDTTDIYRDAAVTRAGYELSGSIETGDSGVLVMFPDGAAGLVWARSTERADRAWAVSLPDEITDADERQRLAAAASTDVGDCVS